jgi:serine/threonine-protein kinase
MSERPGWPRAGERARPVCRLDAGPQGTLDLVLLRHEDVPRLFTLWRPPSNLDPPARGRWLAAARAAAGLRGAHVLAILDEGTDGRGPFLVREHVEGVSAAALLEVARAEGERLPTAFCLAVAAQIARGLDTAHTAPRTDGGAGRLAHGGLALRDVLVGWDGVTRLSGFGLSKALDPHAAAAAPTDEAALADLRALGTALAELLGAAPGVGGYWPGRLPADTPPALATLLRELLAPSPPPPSARVVAERLEAIGGALSGPAGPPDLTAPLSRWFTRQRADVAGLVERALRADLAAPRRRLALASTLVALAALAAAAWMALR